MSLNTSIPQIADGILKTREALDAYEKLWHTVIYQPILKSEVTIHVLSLYALHLLCQSSISHMINNSRTSFSRKLGKNISTCACNNHDFSIAAN